ncbi:MAG: hypothetical protein JW944_05820, partial [Deltaproteobacteria bacterium]|nr:hypothetical protein [Deltaproteobacteria bacterium]
MNIHIKEIIIEEGAHDYILTGSILSKLPGTIIKSVDNDMPLKQHVPGDMDKETIRLIDFKGEFLKPCPGTREYICCGYQILNVGTNCPMDCSYCILQSYFNKPSLRVFA